MSTLESELLGPVVTGVIISSISAFFAQRWRHSFEKRMESDRRIALGTLEVLKTELTFDAEVRRRVASMRVETLGSIAAQSVVLRDSFADLADTVNDPHTDHGHVEDAREKLDAACSELTTLLLRTAHLFSKDVAAHFATQAEGILASRSRATPGMNPTICNTECDNVTVACEDLRDFVRTQLGYGQPIGQKQGGAT